MQACRLCFCMLCLLAAAGCGRPTPPATTESATRRKGPTDSTRAPTSVQSTATAADAPGATSQTIDRAVEPQAPVGVRSAAIEPDALILNNESIAVRDILEPIRARLEELARTRVPSAYVRQRNDLIRRQIVESVAERLLWQEAKLHVTDDLKPQLEKIVSAMEKDRINREFGGRETTYEKHLAASGRTREEVRKQLEKSIVIDRYLHDRLLPMVPAPRKNELKKYYDQNLPEFTSSASREMLLIDVPVAAFFDRRQPINESNLAVARQKARISIDEAATALRSGQSFEEVARKYSHGVNREKGENWGMIAEPLQGRWEVPSKRLFELKSGEVSEVLESAKAFFIVKAGRIEDAHITTFQEAQPRIAEKLRQERFVKLRAEFLQKRFDQSQVGSLDSFFQRCVDAAPRPEPTESTSKR